MLFRSRPRSSSGKLPSLCIPGGSQTRGNDARGHPRRTESSCGPSSAEADAGDRRQSVRQRSVAKAFAASRDRAHLPAQKEPRSAGDAGRSSPEALQKAMDSGAHQRLAGKLPTLGRAIRPFAHDLWRILSYRLLYDRSTKGCAIASNLLHCRSPFLCASSTSNIGSVTHPAGDRPSHPNLIRARSVVQVHPGPPFTFSKYASILTFPLFGALPQKNRFVNRLSTSRLVGWHYTQGVQTLRVPSNGGSVST